MNLIYLSLGSNTGNSRNILSSALIHIDKNLGKILSTSSIYETDAWGKTDQPPFLNQVLAVETKLNAEETLKATLDIEKLHGRLRIEKWAPRTLDIDILYFNQEIIVKTDLKIPHPEIQNRKFVLIPLVEIATDFRHPVLNISNEEMLKRCKDELGVRKV